MNRKNLIVLLALSLAANGFLANMLFTQHPAPPPSPLVRMEKALPVLNAKEQEKVRHILDQHRSKFDTQSDAMHRKIDRIQSVLTAPKLDQKALAQAFDTGADHDTMRENMKSLLTEIATNLSDEDRITFFTETAKQMPPRGR